MKILLECALHKRNRIDTLKHCVKKSRAEIVASAYCREQNVAMFATFCARVFFCY